MEAALVFLGFLLGLFSWVGRSEEKRREKERKERIKLGLEEETERVPYDEADPGFYY